MLAADYARTYRANAILTASPAQLVLLLYDGVLKSLMLAREAFERPEDDPRRVEAINTHLLKAQTIIAELQGGLNHEAGGEFASTMQRLYDYHGRRLFEANMRKQLEPIVEVERLFTDLRDAWAEMLGRQEGTPVEAGRARA
ncbi:MAG TPA: flagellar export chaperone FliS [Opitutus sp.]|nr:flagellar export chaperone FliS [Opitutus sp.]